MPYEIGDPFTLTDEDGGILFDAEIIGILHPDDGSYILAVTQDDIHGRTSVNASSHISVTFIEVDEERDSLDIVMGQERLMKYGKLLSDSFQSR